MASKIFEVSSFWSELRVGTPLRWIATILIALVCFEAVARIAPLVIGKHVHRPFSVTTDPCREACDAQGKQVVWRTNERGARAEMYRGEAVQIAVFGSSTSANSLITQELSWSEQLRAHLPGEAHIDNFARNGTGNKEMESVLQELRRTGAHYRVVLIMDHFGHEERPVDDRIAFRDWARVAAEESLLKSPALLRRKLGEELADPFAGLMATLHSHHLFAATADDTAGSRGFRHPPPLAHSNRELRNQGKVQLVDQPDAEPSAEKRRYIEARVARLAELAAAVADHVYFLTQPVAYDELEVPGVSARWYTLYPIAPDRPVYLSDRSVAAQIRAVQKIVVEAAERSGAEVIDIDGHMRPLLRERDDLFIDKWHFAPLGCAIAGEFLAERLVADGVL